MIIMEYEQKQQAHKLMMVVDLINERSCSSLGKVVSLHNFLNSMEILSIMVTNDGEIGKDEKGVSPMEVMGRNIGSPQSRRMRKWLLMLRRRSIPLTI
jgi:hypothetical protein